MCKFLLNSLIILYRSPRKQLAEIFLQCPPYPPHKTCLFGTRNVSIKHNKLARLAQRSRAQSFI